MTHPSPDAEQALETATLALFAELGWETVDALHEVHGTGAGGPNLGREHRGQVVLEPRLRTALERLNPDLPSQAIALAIQELTRDRSAMAAAHANRDVYRLLKDGVKITTASPDGEQRAYAVRVIDWTNAANNDFLLVQQLWVTGDVYTRRGDLVGFVNGLPLLFGELKAHHQRVEDAYSNNLADYKTTIPHLFGYTALIILSNGSDARLGTLTSGWEHFSAWKKISAEGEQGVISLETMVRGVCEPSRFLDIVENYVLHHEARGGLQQIVAKNHQYLGVENAIDAVREIRENQGRLGVFWHTQGSGKSFSMMFFSQKILRKLGGNWTFVIVTDRVDLDDQIYKNFARCGVVTEPEERARASSREDLQRLLREDHRYVFTLIQKFGTQGGERYPTLSERDDIIVITDEAHRSQYDILAMNMRDALPNAAFIAFTGTPLIVAEEKTREVFGDYVSIYDFGQSVEDRATVPLYYENRIPELELTNRDLNADMERLLEEAELDDEQEAKLARVFARQYHLITRDDRLEKIAEDIADHFANRGYLGKAMIVSIDKLTTVRMYQKVQKYWQQQIASLQAQVEQATDAERDEMEERLTYVEETDMAVVLSQEQGEVAKFAEQGLDILRHRRRIVKEALDEKFKDPDDPFRLAFVCAMWRTGFDAPACSTIYLDRPMRNHTLMQTIARANRVFGEKVNGLIVDYVGIFRELQRALAIYGSGVGGAIGEGDGPIQDKEALVGRLQEAIARAEAFCQERGVSIAPILQSEGFERIALMDDAVESIIDTDDHRREYLDLAASVDLLFHAILPDVRAGEFSPKWRVFTVLAKKIRALTPPADISGVLADVEELLDGSVAAHDYVIREPSAVYDLSKIDFEKLQKQFAEGHKNTAAQRLRGTLGTRLRRMVQRNRSRMDYLEAFQRLIDEYNAGSLNVGQFFDELVKLAGQLDAEEQRAVTENLSEEELAVFDILTRPGPEMTEKEKGQVKAIAGQLLATLKHEKLVLDWRKHQSSRAGVQVFIRDTVWNLPECYSETACTEKSAAVYQHVYDSYWGAGQSVYAMVG